MEIETKKTNRSGFIKQIMLGLISAFSFGLIAFKTQKEKSSVQKNINTLSDSETNKLTALIDHSKVTRTKPELPPHKA